MNWKAAWTWFVGFAAGPVGIYYPWTTSILDKGWSVIPNEVHTAAISMCLAGLGLVQMKRPKDHDGDNS